MVSHISRKTSEIWGTQGLFAGTECKLAVLEQVQGDSIHFAETLTGRLVCAARCREQACCRRVVEQIDRPSGGPVITHKESPDTLSPEID